MVTRILHGDCRDMLRTLDDESVHCCITSPPYWGLRDYGTAKWEGGDPECKHSVGATGVVRLGHRQDELRATGQRPGVDASRCRLCGAHRIDSQLGLEPTFQLYVDHLVEVFREVRRVLRRDGTLWLNLGDSYAGGGRGGGSEDSKQRTNVGSLIPAPKWSEAFRPGNFATNGGNSNRDGLGPVAGLKPKDLVGIPWRVAFALQADGWYLRQDLIWSKPNSMPESVRDRCTKAHEYIFLLSKSDRYYYDADAIAEPSIYAPGCGWDDAGHEIAVKTNGQKNPAFRAIKETRNRRSVWEIATAPFSEAHFAAFPPTLIEPCILAGTSAKGCCAKCGAPYIRMQQRKRTPSCKCEAGLRKPVVLDPFGGSGTTGMVAQRLGRDSIMIELSEKYVEIMERRLHNDSKFAALAPPPGELVRRRLESRKFF